MELYCLDLGKKLLFAWVGAWSLSNKSFSSITAYLVYWVIVTNTVVVFHNQIFVRSEHRTSSFRGTSGGILSYKVGQFPTSSLLTLWKVFFADIRNNGKVISSTRVEVSTLFRDSATQIFIGPLVVSLHQLIFCLSWDSTNFSSSLNSWKKFW